MFEKHTGEWEQSEYVSVCVVFFKCQKLNVHTYKEMNLILGFGVIKNKQQIMLSYESPVKLFVRRVMNVYRQMCSQIVFCDLCQRFFVVLHVFGLQDVEDIFFHFRNGT